MAFLYLKNSERAMVVNPWQFKDLVREHMGDDAAYWFQKEIIDREVRLKEDLKWYVENWDKHVVENEYSDLKDFLEDFINN